MDTTSPKTVLTKQRPIFLGKYLRAVERTTLVTSTWDAFPPPNKDGSKPSSVSVALGPLPLSSAPATPMFSPIPFLHDDARRSHSRSPPPSPLSLPAADGNLAAIMPPAGSASLDQKALGLVDDWTIRALDILAITLRPSRLRRPYHQQRLQNN
ncbi:hypothetical protein BC629DRAFT_1719673 [Irpex lacteus]|nr:hypothetical protein BC629DRAFT_1719673 [Irpex lacteus]